MQKKKHNTNWTWLSFGTLCGVLGSLVTSMTLTTCLGFRSLVDPVQREIKPLYTDTTMSVTAYHAEPNKKSATMTKLRSGLDAAVSRDRLDLLGKRVYVMCPDTRVGIRQITDLMHTDVRNTIDLYVPNKETAMSFGRQVCTVVPLRD